MGHIRPSTRLMAAAVATVVLAALVVLGAGSSASAAVSGPVGPSGAWTNTFDSEFDGTTLNTAQWAKNWYGEGGKMNNVGTYARNVSMVPKPGDGANGGEARLQLEGTTSSTGTKTVTGGALIHTDISGGYKLPVGSYVEARIFFPGPSATALSNWSAWWASSALADGWPSSGEHDIAEILSGQLTVNYHSPTGAHNQGAVTGFKPGNSWHTYGLYRGAGFADVYWDGVKVKHYATSDNGRPEILILNVGKGSNTAFDAAGAMRIDYVRAWKPAA